MSSGSSWSYSSLAAQTSQAKTPRLAWIAGGIGAGLLILLISAYHTPSSTAWSVSDSLVTHSPNSAIDPVYSVPRDIEKAIARSEELWQKNVDKRKQFIQKHDGVDKMFMFSLKPWGRVQSKGSGSALLQSLICTHASIYGLGRISAILAVS